MPCKNCDLTLKSLSPARTTDLKTRLRSNHLLSTPEADHASDLLLEAKSDLLRCDAQISRLHSIIISLESKRDDLKSRICGYSSLLSPIRTLPAEVLTDIFLHHRGKNEIPGTRISAPTTAPALLSLSAVCAYWRNIILSTTCLWSTITLGDRYTAPQDHPLLNLYLQRSGQSPLTLDLRMANSIEAETLELCVPHSHRWLDVTLPKFCGTRCTEMVCNPQGSFPILERLYFYPGMGDAETVAHNVVQNMPSLRTLSLGNDGAKRNFPLVQITRLTLECSQVSKFLETIAVCPNVEASHLVLESDFSEGQAGESEALVPNTTSQLRTFSLDVLIWWPESPNLIEQLLNAVTFPRITSMNIRVTYSLGSRSHPFAWARAQDAFISFLTRSACRLTTLRLDGTLMTDIDLIGLLRLMVSLTSLSVEDWPYPGTSPVPYAITNTLFQTLKASSGNSHSSSQSTLVPNVQEVHFEAHGCHFRDQCFVDMVKSRWSSQHIGSGARVGLRSIHLRIADRVFDRTVYEPLRHLEKAGLNISVHDSDGWVE